MKWYVHVLQHYVDFSGRARRSEYWMFALINFFITIVLAIPVYVFFATRNPNDPQFISGFQTAAILVNLYSLGILLPSLAVQVRRLHDIGKSGWWYFILFVPFVGALILLVFNCMDGQPGPNQWGNNPKDPGVGAAIPA